ncbi:MAG TPA: glyoxalase [Cytophagales bacterium]|nr:glyoxalase [Cytophagales bacterium]HAA19137.1 glyoxalase [Cytophagales bacterium]HAP62704.1 glyoxalase [Cytophagales bacterium]
MAATPFHLAFPVKNLHDTRSFYEGILGCSVGRTSESWIDFNFFGHQVTAHLKPEELTEAHTNAVDGKSVPVRHFGAILEWEAWHALADKMKELSTDFIIEPHIRFPGEVGEQATMFFLDPSGNALEFKSFRDKNQVFAS